MARMGRGLSQEALAEKSGVSQNTIYSYEVGIRLPGAKILIAIADVLEVSLDWLCGREGRNYDH
jgi:transcriptional regulator with XRE-family HTH domain